MTRFIIKAGPIAVILLAWFFTYYQGITTAIHIWSISEIFNHCFLVIPGAFFLIYQKRNQLYQQSFVANYWLLLPLFGALILYVFGSVGDIRLFMHVATFTSLPLLIWLLIGNQAAKIISFPLYFMVFAIPVGEQLIPFLQEITTDLAVPLLELTGVPVYRNGLYLEIPEGNFLVAEACSGVSFLISSIVFGHIYAYISFRTLPKRLIFVFISIVIPIIANAIRVYGIVLIAHLTDMEHAAGADHLVYGGVFFAIVLFLLIIIGDRFRDKSAITEFTKNIDKEASGEKVIGEKSKKVMPFIIMALLPLITNVWLSVINNNSALKGNVLTDDVLIVDLAVLPIAIKEGKTEKWQPNFSKASNIQQGYFKGLNNSNEIDFYIATYFAGEGELISAGNKLYSADRWTLMKSITVSLDDERQVQLIKVVSAAGQYRYIYYWYQLSNKAFTSNIKLKLYQTWMAMLGQAPKSAIIALSIESEENIETVISILQPNVNIIHNSIKG